mmetsp:Transcript_48206/g.95132  ORF Transcript_48206/g.95132 Transcript_48206/m.95132 type:complete len:80 (-) Transcript_48206:13-252(-)
MDRVLLMVMPMPRRATAARQKAEAIKLYLPTFISPKDAHCTEKRISFPVEKSCLDGGIKRRSGSQEPTRDTTDAIIGQI